MDAVTRSGVRRGRAVVFAADPSCSIMINERESGLLTDLKKTIERLGARDRARPPVGSASVVLPVDEGRVQLGTWQRVLLVELAEPSERAIDIQVIGER